VERLASYGYWEFVAVEKLISYLYEMDVAGCILLSDFMIKVSGFIDLNVDIRLIVV